MRLFILGLILSLSSFAVVQQRKVSEQIVLDPFTQATNPTKAACYVELNQLEDVMVNNGTNTCDYYQLVVDSESGGVCTVGGGTGGGGSDVGTLGRLHCSANQIAKWNGSVWICAADDGGTGGGSNYKGLWSAGVYAVGDEVLYTDDDGPEFYKCLIAQTALNLNNPATDTGSWRKIDIYEFKEMDGVVIHNQIGLLAVNNTHLAPDAVSTSKILRDSVSEIKLTPAVRTKLNASGGGVAASVYVQGGLIGEDAGSITLTSNRQWKATGVTVPDGVQWLAVDLGSGHAEFELVYWPLILAKDAAVAGAVSQTAEYETVTFHISTTPVVRIGRTATNEILFAHTGIGSNLIVPQLQFRNLTSEGAPGPAGVAGADGLDGVTTAQVQTLIEGAGHVTNSQVQGILTAQSAVNTHLQTDLDILQNFVNIHDDVAVDLAHSAEKTWENSNDSSQIAFALFTGRPTAFAAENLTGALGGIWRTSFTYSQANTSANDVILRTRFVRGNGTVRDVRDVRLRYATAGDTEDEYLRGGGFLLLTSDTFHNYYWSPSKTETNTTISIEEDPQAAISSSYRGNIDNAHVSTSAFGTNIPINTTPNLLAVLKVLDKLTVSGGGGDVSIYKAAWAPAANYVAGDIVSFGSSVWIADDVNTNSEPSSTNVDWIEISPVTATAEIVYPDSQGRLRTPVASDLGRLAVDASGNVRVGVYSHAATGPVVTYRDFISSDLPDTGKNWRGVVAYTQNVPNPAAGDVAYSVGSGHFIEYLNLGGGIHLWGSYRDPFPYRGYWARKSQADAHIQAVGDKVLYVYEAKVATAFTAATPSTYAWERQPEIQALYDEVRALFDAEFTDVIANPTGPATAALKKLQVGETVYSSSIDFDAVQADQDNEWTFVVQENAEGVEIDATGTWVAAGTFVILQPTWSGGQTFSPFGSIDTPENLGIWQNNGYEGIHVPNVDNADLLLRMEESFADIPRKIKINNIEIDLPDGLTFEDTISNGYLIKIPTTPFPAITNFATHFGITAAGDFTFNIQRSDGQWLYRIAESSAREATVSDLGLAQKLSVYETARNNEIDNRLHAVEDKTALNSLTGRPVFTTTAVADSIALLSSFPTGTIRDDRRMAIGIGSTGKGFSRDATGTTNVALGSLTPDDLRINEIVSDVPNTRVVVSFKGVTDAFVNDFTHFSVNKTNYLLGPYVKDSGNLNYFWDGPNNTRDTVYSATEPYTSGTGILAFIENINVTTYAVNPNDDPLAADSTWRIDPSFAASNTTNDFFLFSLGGGLSLNFGSTDGAEWTADWEDFHEALRGTITIVMRNASGDVRSFMLSEATRTAKGRYNFPTDTSKYFTGANIDIAIVDTSNLKILSALNSDSGYRLLVYDNDPDTNRLAIDINLGNGRTLGTADIGDITDVNFLKTDGTYLWQEHSVTDVDFHTSREHAETNLHNYIVFRTKEIEDKDNFTVLFTEGDKAAQANISLDFSGATNNTALIGYFPNRNKDKSIIYFKSTYTIVTAAASKLGVFIRNGTDSRTPTGIIRGNTRLAISRLNEFATTGGYTLYTTSADYDTDITEALLDASVWNIEYDNGSSYENHTLNTTNGQVQRFEGNIFTEIITTDPIFEYFYRQFNDNFLLDGTLTLQKQSKKGQSVKFTGYVPHPYPVTKLPDLSDKTFEVGTVIRLISPQGPFTGDAYFTFGDGSTYWGWWNKALTNFETAASGGTVTDVADLGGFVSGILVEKAARSRIYVIGTSLIGANALTHLIIGHVAYPLSEAVMDSGGTPFKLVEDGNGNPLEGTDSPLNGAENGSGYSMSVRATGDRYIWTVTPTHEVGDYRKRENNLAWERTFEAPRVYSKNESLSIDLSHSTNKTLSSIVVEPLGAQTYLHIEATVYCRGKTGQAQTTVGFDSQITAQFGTQAETVVGNTVKSLYSITANYGPAIRLKHGYSPGLTTLDATYRFKMQLSANVNVTCFRADWNIQNHVFGTD